MRCGLRSKAAGVKSCQSGDIEVIIKKSSMVPQYESPGRDKLEWERLSRISATGGGEVDVAIDRSVEVSTGAVYEASSGAGIVNAGLRFQAVSVSIQGWLSLYL